MDISSLQGEGYSYHALSEVSDLVIDNARIDKATRVRILSGDTVLLDNDYYGDPNREIHLDIREIVRNHTWLSVPGLTIISGKPSMMYAATPARTLFIDEQSSGRVYLRLEVTRYNDTTTIYTALVFLCEKILFTSGNEAESFYPEIDELEVPEDYLIPMSKFELFKEDNDLIRLGRVEVISSRGTQRFDGPSRILPGDAVMCTQLVKMENVPHEIGEPFYMAISSYTGEETGNSVSGIRHTIYTPRFKVVRKQMEQYAFLSPEGIYYNIPMAGTLRYIPEYDISILRRTGSFENTGGFISDLHEQNSGPLSRKTALALSKYLCSDMVYRFDSDKEIWRRIVIENPSVSIANSGGVYSLTFQWRYEDNNEYFNY